MNATTAGYPAESVEVRSIRDGRLLVLRPLGPADAPLMQAFVRRLSPESRRKRFHSAFSELYPSLLAHLTEIDHRERVAFAAVVYDKGAEVMIGEARYAPGIDLPGSSEFALAVADDWQDSGVGTLLMATLLRHARRAGVPSMHGDVLRENEGMLRFASRFGFKTARHPDGEWLARVTISLPQPPSAALPRPEAIRRAPAPA